MEYSLQPAATDTSIEIESISPLPPVADEVPGPVEEYDDDEEDIYERDNRCSGKGLYAVMGIIAVLAAAALAVASTLLVQNNRSIKAAEQAANPPPPTPPPTVPTTSNTYPPSFRGTNYSATTNAPTVNGTQQDIIFPFYTGDDDESTPTSNLTEAETILNGTVSNGTAAEINVTIEAAPTPEPTDAVEDVVDTPAPTDAVTATPTPEPTVSFNAPSTPEPTELVATALDSPSPTDAVTTVETPAPTEANTTVVTATPTPEPTGIVTSALDSPSPTDTVTAVDTPGPTEGNTTAPTNLSASPTPEPSELVTNTALDSPSPTDAVTPEPTGADTTVATATPTLEPTENVTTPPTPVPTPEPTAVTAVDTPKPTEGDTTELTTDFSAPPASSSLWPGESSYCVNIKFTSSQNYPKDNGFTFLSTKSGEVIDEEKAGFMTKPQTEYLRKFCNLSPGSYTLVVTDTGRDGMYSDGKGSYVVDIDGRVVLVGGRFRTNEISHEILVGFNTIMSEADQEFLDAHNSHREKFHESQDVSFRPMAWSAELAAGASAWAKEKAKTCMNSGQEPGKYGQNSSFQRLPKPDVARTPKQIVNSWFNKFDPEQSVWNSNLQPGAAVLWRSALYVGCADVIAPIDNCPANEACLCQVTNCRYVRTTNCGVKKDNWVASVIDDNGSLCNTVFCPGADENGNIVEGACHV
jgi:hypothetical protein